MLSVIGVALAGCNSVSGDDAALRAEAGKQAVAAAGTGAKLLAVCGPFAPEGDLSGITLPQGGKYVSFVENAGGDLTISTPFLLPSNPAIEADGSIVATVDGNRVEPSGFARNSVIRSRQTNPLGSKFEAVTWAVDQRGAPDFDRRETFRVDMPKAGKHSAIAIVSAAPAKGTLRADCD